tara:strand:+ start:1853 stop:2188 length:336 start_codon:yes stop_codon:yes gene_type:complete
MTKEKIKLSKDKKEAYELLQSMRGQYIIGQALYLAISKLKEVPKERREISNMADMELLAEQLFNIGYAPTKLIYEGDAFKDLLDKSQMGVLSNIVDDKSEDSEDTNNKLKN